jgi:aminopeptidase N
LNTKQYLKQALYFIGSQQTNDLQIWTQGQGRYTSNWFPSFDDVNEKMIFNLSISYDSSYQVIKWSISGENNKESYH